MKCLAYAPVTVPTPGKHGALATEQTQTRIMPYRGHIFGSNPYENKDNPPHKGAKENSLSNLSVLPPEV